MQLGYTPHNSDVLTALQAAAFLKGIRQTAAPVYVNVEKKNCRLVTNELFVDDAPTTEPLLFALSQMLLYRDISELLFEGASIMEKVSRL